MTTRSVERFLSIGGAVICLISSIRIWQDVSGQQPMWPLPGLYLVEMVVLSAIAMGSIVRDIAHAEIVTWVVAGVLFAFVVMGVFSIGLLFLPVALLFAVTAILTDRRHRQSLVPHVGLGVIAGIIQLALMIIAIRWLYPNAIF